MTAVASVAHADREAPKQIEALFDRLWPILRSLTGKGVRETHDILSEYLPLQRIEVPSGKRVFDWVIPKEWNVREAYLIAPDGSRILDVADNNLRLVNYSVPFRGTLSRAALDAHLYSRHDMPDAIPYVTSYYQPRWGFCLSETERQALPEGNYQVIVDTELSDGALTISEAVLRGRQSDEVLISTYTCHPSLANNELSGPLVAAFLYRRLLNWPDRRLTYRFVFAPETIGAIAYLALCGDHLGRHLIAGYIATCAGLDTHFTYKRSRRADSLADRVAIHALKHLDVEHHVRDFAPTGSDERQYCSPGFDLPVGSLMRGAYGEYNEYHTSFDNKTLIDFNALQGSVSAYEAICRVLDCNVTFENLFPNGEPQLGRRGLYPTLGAADQSRHVEALMWVLNMSDGKNDLLSIAERSRLPIAQLWSAALPAETAGLLRRVGAGAANVG